MKKYERNMEKYERNMKEYRPSDLEKFRAFQQEGGGNLTRTQFLRWPPVPKEKAGLPPKKSREPEPALNLEFWFFFKLFGSQKRQK